MKRYVSLIAVLFLLFQLVVSAGADETVELSDELFYSPGNPRKSTISPCRCVLYVFWNFIFAYDADRKR